MALVGGVGIRTLMHAAVQLTSPSLHFLMHSAVAESVVAMGPVLTVEVTLLPVVAVAELAALANAAKAPATMMEVKRILVVEVVCFGY